MRIILLSDANNPHTIKWIKGIALKKNLVYLFSLTKCNHSEYKNYENIEVIDFNFNITTNAKFEGTIGKLKYLRVLNSLKSLISRVKPDILHAHYASSYGLLGSLSGFHPFIISVWGNDVYEFPNKSFFHKNILKFNLKIADKILSTSHVMAEETSKYTNESIEVTPFGIDLEFFKPLNVDSVFNEDDIVIGTVKTLEYKYGIEYLIRAFKILVDKYPKEPLKLLIVGKGSLEEKLKSLVKNLNLEEKTKFTGRVPYSEVPKYHNMLDISVSVSISNSESFGVAIIEASACEKPVVVSNVGGLPEVVENQKTGIIVPPKSPESTAEAIEKFIFDKNLRREFGKNGRERVRKFYNWDDNLSQMIEIYKDINK